MSKCTTELIIPIISPSKITDEQIVKVLEKMVAISIKKYLDEENLEKDK